MNSILFKLFTNSFSPTSTLFRLVDGSRLRSYNKTVFLVSTCFGWLIGHLFVVKCMENSLVWKSNVTTPIRNLAIDLWSKLQDFRSELRSIWVKVGLKAETLFDES
jgi:hypothetical protein